MINPKVADLRKDYRKASLDEQDIAQDPFVQFDTWWQEALNAGVDEANAMTLSTVSKDGFPTSRIVLLKSYDRDGFIFFTNYTSKKGQNMAENPHVALLFFWRELERQVRVEGSVRKVSPQDSDIYYNSRPLGSRIGAIASPQSQVIPNREYLEAAVSKLEAEYKDHAPQRPEHWGGYIVVPELVEFWQGRSSRLHDRIQYTKDAGGKWQPVRLAP